MSFQVKVGGEARSLGSGPRRPTHSRVVTVGATLQQHDPAEEPLDFTLGDDPEYEELLRLAAGPLPPLEPPAQPSEALGADVLSRLTELQASGDLADSDAVRAALEAVGAAHRQTMDAVHAVLVASGGRTGDRTSDTLTLAALATLDSFARRPEPRQPDIHVHTPKHDIHVDVDTPAVHPHFTVEAPQAPVQPIQVDVHVPEQPPPLPAPVNVTLEAAAPAVPDVHVHVPPPPAEKPKSVRIEYDDDGFRHYVVEPSPDAVAGDDPH